MDIRQADMGLLLALDTLLTEGSVTAAAKSIGISQPAFSAQLARLRDLFSDPLMVPSGRRLVPTARAMELQVPLRQLLSEINALVTQPAQFDPLLTERAYSVIGTDYSHMAVTHKTDLILSTKAPKARLSMTAPRLDAVWQALEADRADLAIVTSFVTINDAKSVRLFSEDFVFMQRKSHPRGTSPLTLETLCRYDHILVSPSGGSFDGIADKALDTLGHRRRVARSVPSFLMAPQWIQMSDYVCIIPRRIAALYRDGLDIFELPFELEGFEMVMLWHPKYQNDPGHIFLRECVKASI